ncbi:MAG TPA: hypothetical protein VGQ21_15290 [Thermoanaerobaculia bacterium]|jgi:hypothetical protein|nr:hypothetical protein [Thermoanaerobaculia bacterium]
MVNVEIHFRGICTHFHHNFVPGVPHRVVLPNATAVNAGLLNWPIEAPTEWKSFFLMPHVPVLSLDDSERWPFPPDDLFQENGYLVTPSRMEILNATDSGISYPVDSLESSDSFLKLIPQLTTFFPQYIPSDDVLTGGRASAYFDLYAGEVIGHTDVHDKRVHASLTTDGPPLLRVSPLSTADRPATPKTYKLPTVFSAGLEQVVLYVGNLGITCEDGISNLDFLLHYLTARMSIPRNLAAPTPGMDLVDLCPPAKVPAMLKELIKMDYPHRIRFPHEDDAEKDTSYYEASAACSDSRYP